MHNWLIINKLGESSLTSVSPVPILPWVYGESTPTPYKMPDYARPAAPESLTVAVTGASGAVFARELLLALERDSRVKTVNLILSDNALRVMAEELGITGRGKLLEQLLVEKSPKIQQQNNDDIGASVASGSYPVDAMIVIPCSMGTLARIANGIANKLIERAADVCLKEGRPLVLCVRETPLSRIHLENMLRAQAAGAVVMPVIPAFYAGAKTIEDLVTQYVCRVLEHLDLPQDGQFRWQGQAETAAARRLEIAAPSARSPRGRRWRRGRSGEPALGE